MPYRSYQKNINISLIIRDVVDSKVVEDVAKSVVSYVMHEPLRSVPGEGSSSVPFPDMEVPLREDGCPDTPFKVLDLGEDVLWEPATDASVEDASLSPPEVGVAEGAEGYISKFTTSGSGEGVNPVMLSSDSSSTTEVCFRIYFQCFRLSVMLLMTGVSLLIISREKVVAATVDSVDVAGCGQERVDVSPSKGKEVMREADLKVSEAHVGGPKLLEASIRADKGARKPVEEVIAPKPVWSASQVPRCSRRGSKRGVPDDAADGPVPKRSRKDRVEGEGVEVVFACLARRIARSVEASIMSGYGQVREETEKEALSKVKLDAEGEVVEGKVVCRMELEGSLDITEEQVKMSEQMIEELAASSEAVERLKAELELSSSRETQSRLDLELALVERDNMTRYLDDNKCTVESVRAVGDCWS